MTAVARNEPAVGWAPPLVAADHHPLPLAEDRAADLIPDGRLEPFPERWWRRPLTTLWWLARAVYGLVGLVLLLAVIAAIPVVNLLALGYLLAAEGGLARSGRLADAFPLLRVSPRITSLALGFWVWLGALALLSQVAADAQLIDPGSELAYRLARARTVAWLVVSVHLCLALARGGSLGCFFRPIKNAFWFGRRLLDGTYWDRADAAVCAFLSQLQLREHFLLGLKGYLGAFLWLVIPTGIYAATRETLPGQAGGALFGGFLLALVLSWLPFLQAHFAAEGRFAAFRELGTVRKLIRHAPLCWLLAVVLVYVLTLPLFLFKIALLPQDALWGITLVYILSIYPTRVATGWAYYHARQRMEQGRPAWLLLRWLVSLASWALLAAYVFILYFTQYITAYGRASLFEHHAFLLPVPF